MAPIDTSQRKGRKKRTSLKKTARGTNNSRYIHKILKSTCPGLSITKPAMDVMNSFVDDLMERIVREASELFHHSERATMQLEDIISATKLVIPKSELCKFAVKMAYDAVSE